MIRRIDHIGLAVNKIGEHLPFWCEILGLELQSSETVLGEKVRVAFLPVGESTLELLEATDESSTIARFIEKRGEGIHHVNFEVDNLNEMIERLREREIPLVGEAPRIGAGGHKVAFVHPRATGGVLVELCERVRDRKSVPARVEPGAPVLLYLREPQEKLWGVLRELNASGVTVEGVDLASFDDWVAQVERNEPEIGAPSVLFVPMIRIEKILLDRASGEIPSLAERFEQRTGFDLDEYFSDRRR